MPIRKSPIEKLLEKVRKLNKEGKKTLIVTRLRSCIIYPEMDGHDIAVHNGKSFTKVHITFGMIGSKLGEFSPTRRLSPHGKAGTH